MYKWKCITVCASIMKQVSGLCYRIMILAPAHFQTGIYYTAILLDLADLTYSSCSFLHLLCTKFTSMPTSLAQLTLPTHYVNFAVSLSCETCDIKDASICVFMAALESITVSNLVLLANAMKQQLVFNGTRYK